jgi:hypothetical protein
VNTISSAIYSPPVSLLQNQRNDARVPPDSASPSPNSDTASSRQARESTAEVSESKVESSNGQRKAESVAEQRQLDRDQKLISELSARDREVRAHEQAHAAIGGRYAGAPQYTYQRGPDGVSYAVGGEVSIDVSEAATPRETILKMQVVRRAALAPAEPSSQDRRVAAKAASIEANARQQLNLEEPETGRTESRRDDEPVADARAQNGSGGQGVGVSSVSENSAGDSRPRSRAPDVINQILSASENAPRVGASINSRA